VCEGERIDRELGNWSIGPSVGLVVKDMNGAVSDLQNIDMAGDRSRATSGEKSRAVFLLDGSNIIVRERHRHLDGDHGRIIGEHEALKFWVAFVVGADSGKDESGHFGRRILFRRYDKIIRNEKIGSNLRASSAIVAQKEIMRARLRYRFEKIRECAKTYGGARRKCALGIKCPIPEEAELCSVVGKLVHLAVIELDRSDGLRRFERLESACAEPRVCGEPWVLGNPPRYCRGEARRPNREEIFSAVSANV